MNEKLERVYLKIPQHIQENGDLSQQADTELVRSDDMTLSADVKHFMNGVNVFRSTDTKKQLDLFLELSKGVMGYKKIDFASPEILSVAFALYVDFKISRFDIETLLDIYHSYHIISYHVTSGNVYSEQHQLPMFYDIFNEKNEITDDAQVILINQLKWGLFFSTKATDDEILDILNKIRMLPKNARFFYTVEIPNDSHARKILNIIVKLLNYFPLKVFQNKILLTMLPVHIMHIIGQALFQDSYVPNTIMLGDISANQIMSSMEYGVRPRSSYIPWSQVSTTGSFHKHQKSSVLSATLHDIYHSFNASKCTNYIGMFCDKVINIIRDKLLAKADWNSPSFYGRKINPNSCHAIWVLSEREFYARIAPTFRRVDLRNKHTYKLAEVMYEIFYSLAKLFKTGSNEHLELFLNTTQGFELIFSPMGITLLVDFVIHATQWAQIGFKLEEFKSLIPNNPYTRDYFVGNRLKYNIIGYYEIQVKPYINYFTGDAIRDFLKYVLFNNKSKTLGYDDINHLVNELNPDELKKFRFRRNNLLETLDLYHAEDPYTPIITYNWERLIQCFSSADNILPSTTG